LLLFLVIAYFLVPYKIIGWHKANVRLVPFIAGLLLAGVASLPHLNVTAAVRRSFIATVVAATACVTALMTPEIIRMEALVREYNSGIEAFETNARLLPILVENPAFGAIRPITRAHEYYHLAKGGANGGSIPSMNTLSVMWYREYPVRKTFPRFESGDAECLAAIGAAYDFVLVFGEDPAVDSQIESAGFSEVHREGRTRLFRNSRQTGSTGAESTATASVER
jgi:hypothetical protein